MSAVPGLPLYIHIGLQKTGTSYLQSIFWQSTKALAAQGVDMVPETKRATFNLMLDVRGRYNAEFDPAAARRAVDELPRRLARATGSRALITEESLAPSSDEQIRRLLVACRDREVHLIATVRDLARAIPSAWQQTIQGGASESFDDYLVRLQKNESQDIGRLWRNKDVPGIVRRWAQQVPAERIHVVTVPASGSDPQALLTRFCSVIDVDPSTLDTEVARSNEALRHIGAEVLRRVNSNLGKDFRRRDVYGDIGKRYFAIQVLGRESGRKIRLPHDLEDWVRSVSQRHIDFLREGGFDVVGDLADLEPRPDAFADDDIVPSEAEVAEVATEALATLLTKQMKQLRRRRSASPQPRVLRLARKVMGAGHD
jgi:hypothetical protein